MISAFIVVILGAISLFLVLTMPPADAGQSFNSLPATAVVLSQLHARGDFVNGHDVLTCTECHHPSQGTTRQQVQALVRNLLFNAGYEVDFGFEKVSSQMCLACHARSDDRHPIYRFNEPRFIEAVKEVPANSCLGCHSEHNGRTVNLKEVTYCKACHSDLTLKNDPVDISHEVLVKSTDWGSCLGCHDFHGNHQRSTQLLYGDAVGIEEIEAYFAGGPSPYGQEKKSKGVKQ